MYSTDGIYLNTLFKLMETLLESSETNKTVYPEDHIERLFIYSLWSVTKYSQHVASSVEGGGN